MNYENLEAAWAAQAPVKPMAVDAAALKRHATRELRRRRRMLGYGVWMTVFVLVAAPALAVANYRHAPLASSAWHWAHLAIWMAAIAGLLVGLIRSLRRDRALSARLADNLRAVTEVALATVERERADYRRGAWVGLGLVGLDVFGLALSFPVAGVGWEPLLVRAAAVLGSTAAIGLVFWRHYRVNLTPTQVRLAEILRQLE